MNNSSSKVLWVLLGLIIIALIIVLSVTGGKGNKTANETGPIKIGFVSPLSGDAAAYGESVRGGVSLWAEQLNASGGIDGRQVEVIYEDGKCEGKSASLATQKLITVDKVQVIIGGGCSGETLAAAPIAEAAKVLMISPVSSAPLVSEAGDYIFRTHPSDLISGKKLAEVVQNAGLKKVAVLSEQTDYSQGIRKAFVDDIKPRGVEVVYDEAYASDVNDFKSFAVKINASGAEGVFIDAQTGAAASRIAKALRDTGSKAQFYGLYFTGDDFVKSGSSVNGTVMIDASSVSNKELGDKFTAEYKAKYGNVPEYPLFANIGYDTGNILALAIDKVGYDATKIKDYLYKMPAYKGITGNLTFDQNGDSVGNDLFVVKQVQNNVLVDYK